MLCGLHWAKETWSPHGPNAKYADAFLTEFERTAFREFGHDIARSAYNKSRESETSATRATGKTKVTTAASTEETSIAADDLVRQYNQRVKQALEVRKRIVTQIPKQSLGANFVDPDHDLYTLFRVLELIGWGAILAGIYAFVSEAKLDYLHKTFGLFKTPMERSSSAAASILMVGSVAAGSVYLANTDIMAPSTRSVLGNRSSQNTAPRPPYAGDDTVDALRVSLNDYALAINSLSTNVEGIKEGLQCTKHPETGPCAPGNVQLEARLEKMLDNGFKALRHHVDTIPYASEIQVANAVRELNQERARELRAVVNEVNTSVRTTAAASAVRHGEEIDALDKKLSSQIADELKATTTVASRLAIMRWAHSTNGKASDFREQNLATMAQVSQANTLLDQLDAIHQEESWYVRPWRLIVPSQASKCLRTTMPHDSQSSALPKVERHDNCVQEIDSRTRISRPPLQSLGT